MKNDMDPAGSMPSESLKGNEKCGRKTSFNSKKEENTFT